MSRPWVPAASRWAAADLWRASRAVCRLVLAIAHMLRVALWMRWVFPRLSVSRQDALVERWSAQLLACLGVRCELEGSMPAHTTLVVSNHISWLDIIALNALRASRFVSKKEVADWPVIGGMVTRAGTLYLDRGKRRDALRVFQRMTDTMSQGHTVVVFPEGTTGDGHQLLPFHANLLQAAVESQMPVQPVLLRYADRRDAVSDAAAYVGDTHLLQSLWAIACADDLTVHVKPLPLMAPPHLDRRALCHALQTQIRAAFDARHART